MKTSLHFLYTKSRASTIRPCYRTASLRENEKNEKRKKGVASEKRRRARAIRAARRRDGTGTPGRVGRSGSGGARAGKALDATRKRMATGPTRLTTLPAHGRPPRTGCAILEVRLDTRDGQKPVRARLCECGGEGKGGGVRRKERRAGPPHSLTVQRETSAYSSREKRRRACGQSRARH